MRRISFLLMKREAEAVGRLFNSSVSLLTCMDVTLLRHVRTERVAEFFLKVFSKDYQATKRSQTWHLQTVERFKYLAVGGGKKHLYAPNKRTVTVSVPPVKIRKHSELSFKRLSGSSNISRFFGLSQCNVSTQVQDLIQSPPKVLCPIKEEPTDFSRAV